MGLWLLATRITACLFFFLEIIPLSKGLCWVSQRIPGIGPFVAESVITAQCFGIVALADYRFNSFSFSVVVREYEM